MSDNNDVNVHIRGRVDGVREAAQETRNTIDDLKRDVVRNAADMAGASNTLSDVISLLPPVFAALSVAALATWRVFSDGRAEMQAMNQALASTGNFAGQTTDSLRTLAAGMAASSSITIGQSKEIATALAASGQIGAKAFGDVAMLATDFARVMGKEVGQIAPTLVKLFADPARGAEELNRTLHFLTATELEAIKTLEDMGRATDAQALAADLLRDHLKGVNNGLEDQISLWQFAKRVGSEFADWAAGINRPKSTQQQIDDLTHSMSPGLGMFSDNSPENRAELERLKARLAEENAAGQREADRGAQEQTNIKGLALVGRYSVSAQARDKDNQIALMQGIEPATVEQANSIAEAVAKLRQERAKLFEQKAAKGVKDPLDDIISKGRLDLLAQEIGMAPATVSAIEKIAQARSVGKITGEEYDRMLSGLLDNDSVLKREQGDLNKTQEQWNRIAEQSVAAVEKENQALQEKIAMQAEHNAAIGQTSNMKGELLARTLELTATAKEEYANNVEAAALAAGPYHDAYVRITKDLRGQAEALRELAALKHQGGVAEMAVEEAKKTRQAWDGFANDIERGLTDSLFRSFESGKGFGESFRDSLERTFKSMVLKFTVQAIVESAGIRAVLGGSAGTGSSGGAFDLINGASSASSLYQLYNGFTTGSGSGLAGSVGNYLGGLAGMSQTTGFAGMSQAQLVTMYEKAAEQAALAGQDAAATAYANAAQQAGTTSGASALSGAASVFGFVLAVGALVDYFDSKEGGPKREGDAFFTVGDSGAQRAGAWSDGSEWYSRGAVPPQMMNGGEGEFWVDVPGALPQNDVAAALLLPLVESARQTIARLGGTAAGLSFGLGWSTDPQGSAPDNISAGVSRDGVDAYRRTYDTDRGGAAAALGVEMQRMLLAAIKASDVDQVFRDMAGSIDLATASAEELTKTFDAIGAAQQQLTAARTAIGRLNDSIADDKTFGNIDKLIKAAGGFDAMAGATSAYFETFFSEEERLGFLREDLTAGLATLNLALPATRGEFRAMVESLDLTTDAGRVAFNTLMAIAPSFASLTEEAEAAAVAVERVASYVSQWEVDMDAAWRAHEAQIQAQKELREGWQETADSIIETMRRLRGEAMDTPQSYAAAAADFAISTAAARAGDKTAADKLPALAEAVVELSRSLTATRFDQQIIAARTLASLRATVEGFAQYGIDIPAFAGGGLHAGGLRLVGEIGPELEATGPARLYSMDQMRGMLRGDEMAAEIRALREEVRRLREDNTAENRAMVRNSAKVASLVERAMPDGDALSVRTAA